MRRHVSSSRRRSRRAVPAWARGRSHSAWGKTVSTTGENRIVDNLSPGRVGSASLHTIRSLTTLLRRLRPDATRLPRVLRRVPLLGCGAKLYAFAAAATLALAGIAIASATRRVYITNPFGQGYEHPSTLAFSTDGDLVGTHLRWQHWGAKTSTAAGVFVFRTSPNAYVRLPGTLTAFERRLYCSVAPVSYFYSRARFRVPGNPWGRVGPDRFLPPDVSVACNHPGPGQ